MLALATNVVLELSDGAKDRECQLTRTGRGIHAALLQAAERDTFARQRLHDAMQVRHRTRQAIEPGNDERVTLAHLIERAGHFRPISRAPIDRLMVES